MKTEIWDDLAKSSQGEIRKGATISGMGSLILNKWIDKTSGEEKKNYVLRVLKLIPSNQIKHLLESIDTSAVSDSSFEDIDNDFEPASTPKPNWTVEKHQTNEGASPSSSIKKVWEKPAAKSSQSNYPTWDSVNEQIKKGGSLSFD